MEVAACKLLSGLKRKKESEKTTYQSESEYKSVPLPKQTMGILIDLGMDDNCPH